MTKLSILDLVMIGEDKDLATSLQDTVRLAQCAERSGYQRYWIAEHHSMPGIGSAATTLIMSHVAAHTSAIRVGSGGMMMPNHSPLIIAEQFGTLDTLYPGRIDLGVGRAPGSDSAAMRAIRGNFPQQRELSEDVTALLDYLADNGRQPARAIPGQHDVPLWILGSGLHGAELAATLGLPFAFASHFAPRHLLEAIALYRQHFRPSQYLVEPYVIAGCCVFAADTKEEAVFLASSHQKWVANLHSGRPGLLPKPVHRFMESLPVNMRTGLQQELACSVIGTRKEVGNWLRAFAQQTSADELMIDARIYDPAARCRSFEIAAAALSASIPA